ncbi:uncharacterized protein UTRI_02274 [Ustilago trichophora]|uniref:AB hydrolase-1 domain-containing protein n=1 Tax=Ustilago trichophora TaxID=86804 RepID=A0A5C3E777_9BASI|nr:uncharacterized protein UTRI_02274 [Ustilago trichophora]
MTELFADVADPYLRHCLKVVQTTPTNFVYIGSGAKIAYRWLNVEIDAFHLIARKPSLLVLIIRIIFAKICPAAQTLRGSIAAPLRLPRRHGYWAKHAVAIADSLGMSEYDVLGFAMGGRLLCSLLSIQAPPLRASMSIAWPRDDWNLMNASRLSLNDGTKPEEVKQALKHTFFTESAAGQQALEKHWERINTFAQYRSKLPSESPFIGLLEDRRELATRRHLHRSMAKINVPVLVMNGINNTLIPASRSWELMCRLPKPALNLYEDSGAGFIWQYPERVAKDINYFLDYDHSNLQPRSCRLHPPKGHDTPYHRCTISPSALHLHHLGSRHHPAPDRTRPIFRQTQHLSPYFANTPTGHQQTHQSYLHLPPTSPAARRTLPEDI